MAGETVITVIGNLTGDPELRFTPSGAAVANFTIASTPRTLDRQTNEWKDGDTLFLRASVWKEAAENVTESLVKGTAVIAQGRLKSRSYETKEGEKRNVTELEIDEIGPSLKRATAKVTRTQRNQQQGGFQGHPQGFVPQGGQQYGQGFGGQPQPGPNNPTAQGWGGQQGSNGGWGNPGGDEPPF